MIGILLAIVVAFLDAGKNIFRKINANKFSNVLTAWAWLVSSLFIMIPALIVSGVPELSVRFWVYVSIKVGLQAVALVLYAKAFKESDISLALPMLALTPLVTTGASLILSREFPSTFGLIGIAVIVVGLYLLKAEKDQGILAPFKAIVSDTGVRSMLFVALIYGLSTSIDKEGVLNSSPIAYSAVTSLGSAIVLSFFLVGLKSELKEAFQFKNLRVLMPAGLFSGLVTIVQMTAVSLTLAAYVISIKRTSIVISSVIAYFVFGEKLKGRLVPILVMLGGLIMIIFS